MTRPFAETTSRASASAVAEILPEDIIIQILLRLPAKSLMRFKCVSKRWRSLISDPGFARSHLQTLKTGGDIIASQRIVKINPLETLDYHGLDDRPVLKLHSPRMVGCDPGLVGSCDGLVCLSVDTGGYLLYNPTTEESRHIPSADLVNKGHAFLGFGYDPASDDYKIVRGDGVEECEVAIFSLKSGSWRRILIQQERHLFVFYRGLYWNGALHWCVDDQRSNKTKSLITSFDLSEEKFHRMLPVPVIDGDTLFDGLGIHGANLLIYTWYADCFVAWITKEYGRGGLWTKLFNLSTKGMPGEYWQIPVAYTRSGQIIFEIDGHNMILFNIEDNTYKDYHSIRESDEFAIYVETLVSPYLGCEPSRT